MNLKSKIINRKFFSPLFFLALLFLMWLIPGPRLLAHPGGTTESARVLTVDNTGLETHGLLEFGTQRLTVRLTAGKFAGKEFAAANEIRAQMELDKKFAPGDAIRVIIPVGALTPDMVLTARDYDRSACTGLLLGGFCLLLILFGGWIGAKALFSFVFSCAVIWKVVIPLALAGWPVSGVCFAAVCLLTAAIMYLVAGWTRVGLVAFLGSILGVFTGLGAAHLFGRLLHINGATMPFVQTLLYSGYEKLNLQDVYIGAMVLACSGAVMDLGMDIASGIREVVRHNPSLGFRHLFLSGLRMGRNVVGTMTTTLLLAYSGGYLTLLMVFAAQGTHPADILNTSLVSAETVKTLVGSFALVLVAPFTALVGAWLMNNRPPNSVAKVT